MVSESQLIGVSQELNRSGVNPLAIMGECSGSSSTSEEFLEVRWSLTGNRVCSVLVFPDTCVAKVKQQICEQTGVPVCEQRLFSEDSELQDADVSLHAVAATAGPVLVRTERDPRRTDLAHFHAVVRTEALIRGDFVTVKRLSTAIYGEVCECKWAGSSVDRVAVKKMKNKRMNWNQGKERCEWTIHKSDRGAATEPQAEDALTEIGIFCLLAKEQEAKACPHLLQMFGAFSDDVDTYLVTELADGGDLFSFTANSRKPLVEQQVRSFTWQLLQALQYLHERRIGHRDISLENALLSRGVLKVMDFGMACQTYAENLALRYFRTVGKDTYRGPECYLPKESEVHIMAPDSGAPGDVVFLPVPHNNLAEVRLPSDAVPGTTCTAEIAGYTVPPLDVFSAGVCAFILRWQVPPWKVAHLSDRYFHFVHQSGPLGLETLLKTWRKPLPGSEAMSLLKGMLDANPARRPTVQECLAHDWFAQERVDVCSRSL